MKFASYLLGHLNGTGGEIDTAPKFKEFLQSSHWLSCLIIELDKAFDGLWENYGKWKGVEDFDCLGELVLDAVSRRVTPRCSMTRFSSPSNDCQQ